MKAVEFLNKAASLLEERGKQYDQPQGERSMGKAVTAFNAITSRDLTEAEGWLLLQLLKDVRQWQNPERYHADSAEDCVSYAALKAEALASSSAKNDPLACAGCVSGCFRCRTAEESAASIDDDSPRAQAIGQNGNTGEHYYENKPSWEGAPEWAMWLGQCQSGEWEWYEHEPRIREGRTYWDHDGRGICSFQKGPYNPDWRNTLEARPCQ